MFSVAKYLIDMMHYITGHFLLLIGSIGNLLIHQTNLRNALGDQLQGVAGLGEAQGERDERDGRGQGEAGPGGEGARVTSAREADGHADLAAGRAGQKLAQRYQIGIAVLVQPAAAHQVAARELRRSGIRVLDARPGHTETELSKHPLAGERPAFPVGYAPAAVVTRILDAVRADEKDLASSAFQGLPAASD